jgi:hypothetical protein
VVERERRVAPARTVQWGGGVEGGPARQVLGRGRDLARYTTARALRRAGFHVVHTPSRLNLDHVSVRFEGDWDGAVRDALVTPEDRRRVDAAATPDELSTVVEELTRPPCVLAAAGEGYGIIAWREVAAGGDADGAVQDLLAEVEGWTGRVRRGAEQYARQVRSA